MLLKIVQGPNAGAEIVLAEGMTLSLGKGDSCDILLADMSLGDVACELEVNAERVRLLLPGGAEERLEPYHVKFLGGTTAIAVGPEKGAWEELVWPSRGASAPEPSQEQAEQEQESAGESSSAKDVARPRYRSCGCIMALIILLVVVGLATVIFLCPSVSGWVSAHGVPVEKVKTAILPVKEAGLKGFAKLKGFANSCSGEQKTALEVLPPQDINSLAAELGLHSAETNGALIVSGNFATRAKRLAATASLYAARPGVKLDLSDDESLRSATAEVLDLVSEGKLKVSSALNRVVAISGFSPSAADLRTVVEAICADVPYVRNVDCSQVRLGEGASAVDVSEQAVSSDSQKGVKAVKASQSRSPSRKSSVPKMPVVGVMTQPYPCIVLKDGSRVTEGAEFSGFIIEKIGTDTIRIRGPEGTFEWKP